MRNSELWDLWSAIYNLIILKTNLSYHLKLVLKTTKMIGYFNS